MAKRSRLASRPGQRRPLERPAPRAAGTRPGLTTDELSRAAELEAAIVAEEKAAEESRRNRDRARDASDAPAVGGVRYSSVPLSVRASEEYAYVRRDVRRIALVGGFLIGILAVLEVLVNVLHLFTL
jgi:hypothetical protein